MLGRWAIPASWPTSIADGSTKRAGAVRLWRYPFFSVAMADRSQRSHIAGCCPAGDTVLPLRMRQ